MKIRNSWLVILVICSLSLGIMNAMQIYTTTNFSDKEYTQKDVDDNNEFINQEIIPKFSTGANYDNIKSIFDAKLNQINSLGWFSQIYESSLQATYYALYTLNAIGKFDTINHTEMLNYIMSHYNTTSGIFMDRSAERYLHTDFSHKYYPLTTLLEINCYAILSLQILGNLSLIDGIKAVNFIWDCYNYDTPGNGNGFIGQPYSASLHPSFRNTTMDNTYYAILALDSLGTGWSGRSEERLELQYFIKNLQITDPAEIYFGGFLNDLNKTIFDSLGIPDPTLLSSYYAVKGLDLLNYFISYIEFNQYLDKHYDDSVPYFKMRRVIIPINYTDIVGTALGLQLADISGYSGIDRNGVINFILNNRNSWGIWDSSRYYSYHELIDTFQVVRALYETGEISQLSSNDKDQIANSIKQYYQQYDGGFSLLSKDYTSLRLLYTNVKSAFSIYAKTEFGDFIQELYEQVVSCYYNPDGTNYHYFGGCVNMYQQSSVDSSHKYAQFRSFPVEFYNPLYGEIYNEIGLPYTHRTTFYALDILYTLGMMGSFEAECNLNAVVDDITDSQFLDNSYINYGGFLPHNFMGQALDVDELDGYIYLEYTYYAIKSLELLVNFLNLGQLTDLSFNKGALYSYIMNNIDETPTTICCKPLYTENIESVLINTYYTIYLLKALNLFDLQKEKIKNFVIQNIDYTNIKNIYYSFKIAEILDLDLEFDIDLTSSLVEVLYSNEFKEYYQSTDFQVLSQDAFLWVCDMALNDKFKIECDYKNSIYLGGVNTITMSFSNMIFTKFDQYFDVQYQSALFGTLPLEKQFDSTYQLSFLVPEDPDYFPEVTGILKIYHHSKLLGELPIIFQTLYEFDYNDNIVEGDDKFYFEYNVSYGFASGKSPADKTRVYATVFKNGSYYKTENFTRDDYADYSKFTLNYSNSDEYTFNITLIDDFHANGLLLNKSINESPPPVNDGHDDNDNGNDGDDDDSDQSSNEPQINWLLTGFIGLMVGLAFSITCLWTYIKKTKRRNRDIDLIEKFGASQEKIPINSIQDSEELNKQFFNNIKSQDEFIGIANPYVEDEIQNPYSQMNQNSSKSGFKQKLMNTLELTNSLIEFVKKNKKLLFFIFVGILMLIGAYYYASTLMILLILGGFIVVVLGVIGLFIFDRKASAKAIIIGFICAGLGYIIFVLKLYMNALMI